MLQKGDSTAFFVKKQKRLLQSHWQLFLVCKKNMHLAPLIAFTLILAIVFYH
jgi:hypothetical protein